MGYPAGRQRGLRSQHGGRAGGLSAAARSGISRGLPGRDIEATHRRNACADRGEATHLLKELSDAHFPKATKIVLVQDNLNTHRPASLYEAFPAAEARRLVERFEWHYTPKHGSWLDMAESELSILSCQCLDRRIADKQTLIEEVAAWEDRRNKNHTKADWQFTTANARVKLKRLYPAI